MKVLTLLLATVLLVSCGIGEDALDKAKKKAVAEEEGNIEAQKKSQKEKAEKMELDLVLRHMYYQSLAGKYEGKLTTVSGVYNIRITMLPSIPPYTGDRERQLSEIENDLNNLFFHVQVVQWHPNSTSAAVGCKLSEVKPNMDSGYFVLASSDCSNLYQIHLSEIGGEGVRLGRNSESREIEMENRDSVTAIAQKVSTSIRASGGTAKVERLVGLIQPSTIAEIYSLDVKRVE